MTYDLFFHDYGMQAFTQRGRDFIGNILSKRPMFAPLDYREAMANGLQVSFRTKAIADQALADDPGSTSTEWKPIDITDVNSGYADGGPFLDVPATTDTANDTLDCEADDSPDAAICPDSDAEDIELDEGN